MYLRQAVKREKSLLLRIALIITMLATALVALPGAAWAAGAALMTSSICLNQRDAFDAIWFQEKFGVENRFFMKDDGVVVNIQPQGPDFDEFSGIYVTAHGSEDESITPFTYAKFVEHFVNAHPSPPSEVYLSTCFSAKAREVDGSTSLLNQLAVAYPGQEPSGTSIDLLSGPEQVCALTGNGSPVLEDAEDTSAPGTSDPNRRKEIIATLIHQWKGGDGVVFPGTQLSFQKYCEERVRAMPQDTLTNFIEKTDAQFGKVYRELISLNEEGDLFTTCGKSVDGAPIRCPQ